MAELYIKLPDFTVFLETGKIYEFKYNLPEYIKKINDFIEDMNAADTPVTFNESNIIQLIESKIKLYGILFNGAGLGSEEYRNNQRRYMEKHGELREKMSFTKDNGEKVELDFVLTQE